MKIDYVSKDWPIYEISAVVLFRMNIKLFHETFMPSKKYLVVLAVVVKNTYIEGPVIKFNLLVHDTIYQILALLQLSGHNSHAMPI